MLKRFSIIFIPLAALATFAFWVLYYAQNKTDRALALSRQSHIVSLGSHTIVNEFISLRSDLGALSRLHELDDLAARNSAIQQARLADKFLEFMNYKELYDQARFIGTDGREIIRVERSGDEYRVVPAAELQNKRDRSYVSRTLQLAPGQIYISAFDLNVEHQEIERPYKPTIRIATPIATDKNVKHGLLILNYNARRLIDRLRKTLATDHGNVSLLNANGYWLVGPSPKDEFAFMFPDLHDRRFGTNYPRAWEIIAQSEQGQFHSAEGLFSFAKIRPASIASYTSDTEIRNDHLPDKMSYADLPWIVVAHIPAGELAFQNSWFGQSLGSLYVLVMMLFMSIAGISARLWKRQIHVQQELRTSEARLSEAQRLAHIGSWESNIQTGELYWSDETYRIFGHEPRAFTPSLEKFFAQVPKIEQEKILSDIESAQKTGGPFSWEHRVIRADGSARVIQARGEVTMDANGNALRIAGTVHDITERQEIERIKDEFISVVSHELRTPLTSIRGALGLLHGDVPGYELSTPSRALVDIAYKNTERLLLLINDILDLNKLEAGSVPLHFQRIELMPFLEHALHINEHYAQAFKVTFHIGRRAEDATVYADSNRLMQAISNLLSNAAKHSPPGGAVEVAVARRQSFIRISISDHGQGIPAEFQPCVFQKFAQADGSSTRKLGGTGLGLHITKILVERQGGRIGFVSRKAWGSTFFIDLLAGLSDATPKNLESARKELESSRQRVLICEDDPATAMLLRMLLSTAGFDADIASTATVAKQLLAANRYIALSLDILLPNQEGVALIHALRNTTRAHELPIIVVSIKADEARHQVSGGAFEIIDWINKPIDEKQLVSAIEQAASRTAAQLPRILHVGADKTLAEFISLLFKNRLSITHVSTQQEARDQCANEKFDLILIDMQLPDGSGLDLLDRLSGRAHPIPVVIFSAREVTQDMVTRADAAVVKSCTHTDQWMETILVLLSKKREPQGQGDKT